MKNLENMSKKTIFVVTDHTGFEGQLAGVGRYFSYVLPQIDKKRFNIIVGVLRNGEFFKKSLSDKGIKVIQFERSKFNPLTLIDFIRIIRVENVDLLHLHQYSCSNFGRIAAKITHIPSILHAHDLNWNYLWYQWLADRILQKTTDYVIAVSESAKIACERNRSIKPDKIVILKNCVPTEQLKQLNPEQCKLLKQSFGINDYAQIVGTVTRLREEKGNEYFLKAAKYVLSVLPNTYFLIVGDGPLMDKLKEMSIALNIDRNVIFTGYQKDVSQMLSIFDIKVIASNTEGCPFSLLEAMAMGKAVVSTGVGGINEIVEHGVSGILVPPRNPHDLAEKIIYLLLNDKIRIKIGTSAHHISKKYSINIYTNQLEDIYEKTICLFRKRLR